MFFLKSVKDFIDEVFIDEGEMMYTTDLIEETTVLGLGCLSDFA